MTQTDRIRAYLEAGNTLTPLDALSRFGCFRLAARVADLRAQGLQVETERIELHDGKHVARYSLPTENEQRAMWGDR